MLIRREAGAQRRFGKQLVKGAYRRQTGLSGLHNLDYNL